jgi:hypothetical protein
LRLPIEGHPLFINLSVDGQGELVFHFGFRYPKWTMSVNLCAFPQRSDSPNPLAFTHISTVMVSTGPCGSEIRVFLKYQEVPVFPQSTSLFILYACFFLSGNLNDALSSKYVLIAADAAIPAVRQRIKPRTQRSS